MRLNTPTESGLRLIIADRSLQSGPRGAQMLAMLTDRPCAGVGPTSFLASANAVSLLETQSTAGRACVL